MANEPKILAFAYGSNMCTQRMHSRVSSAMPVTIGYVRERRFVFHKRSVDGSAKADAAFTASPDDRVWGVVYQLDVYQKLLLDQHEFLGIGYDEEVVEVVHEGGLLRAWMYVARRDAIDASLLQIIDSLLVVTQAGFPVVFDAGHQREQFVVTTGRAVAFVAWHVEPHLSCQAFNRLDKTHVLVFHQEADGSTVCAASEAMVESLNRVHTERRCFLGVEWTES